MCGIVGYVGHREASPIVLSALRRLEYRGYDSAGIATLRRNGSNHDELQIRRVEGSVDELANILKSKPIEGSVAIGHTRWATHGKPSERNAHPHRYEDVVVVHNGIIENYLEIKQELQKKGHQFKSDTDTEVIAHLLQRMVDESGDFEKSCKKIVNHLKGAFAIAALWTKNPRKIFVAKQHSPLLLGLGNQENFVASDIPALLEYTNNFLILNDGEMAFVEPQSVRVMDFAGGQLSPRPKNINWSLAMAEKEGFEHFMLKEIHEQPRVIQDTLLTRIRSKFDGVDFDAVKLTNAKWKSFQKVNFLACGTAWHAGLLGKYWLEKIARIPADAELASEFRYRDPIKSPRSLTVAISQSGETADTLGAVDLSKKLGSSLLAVTNTVDSSLVRKTKSVIYTHAGPEISVASTKCFTAQLAVLAMMAIKFAEVRKTQSKDFIRKFLKDLSGLTKQVEQVLALDSRIQELAKKYKVYDQYFYLGRGISFPIALEGALKLKEIAYINTQAYPAGEMKHGPIALLSDQWPVVCVAPNDSLYAKIHNNMETVKARGAKLIVIGTEGHKEAEQIADEFISIPKVREELSPFLTNICLQFFAYHMAVQRGANVDKPRNLAKSVTVE